MDRRLVFGELLEAITEVVRIKKENDITIQDLHYANKLFQKVACNQEELLLFMQEFAKMSVSLKEQQRRKVLHCILTMYKEQYAFDHEILRILQMRP